MIALIAGGVTAFALLSGRGGADSPAQAVELLAAEVTTADYLSALSLLHPGEADLFVDLNQVLLTELKRLEVIRPDADPTAGFDGITVTDVRFDEAAAETVKDNVVITKLVAGKITIAQDPASLPFTDAFRDAAFPRGLPATGNPTTIDVAELVARTGKPIRIATVRVDGRWYVSVLYTYADLALQAIGKPWPAGRIEPKGPATAQDALRQTVEAALASDVRRLIELAPPGELSVLHDMGQVLVDQAARNPPSGARLIELETTETRVGDTTELGVSRVVVEVTERRRPVRYTVTRDGGCVTVAGPSGSAQPFCPEQLLGLNRDRQPPAVGRVLTRLGPAVLDLKVVVISTGGAYYVSPSRTIVGVYADLLGVLEPADVIELARLANGS